MSFRNFQFDPDPDPYADADPDAPLPFADRAAEWSGDGHVIREALTLREVAADAAALVHGGFAVYRNHILNGALRYLTVRNASEHVASVVTDAELRLYSMTSIRNSPVPPEVREMIERALRQVRRLAPEAPVYTREWIAFRMPADEDAAEAEARHKPLGRGI